MPIGILVFYGIAVLFILGGAISVYLVARRFGQVKAVALGILSAGMLVLVWPIPIHGGFMTLGEAVYSEWSRDRARTAQRQVDRDRMAYLKGLEMRFAGELPLSHRAAIGDGWERVTLDLGSTGWLDTANGQIWSEWLSLPAMSSLPSLEVAKRRCQEYPPDGYWSLPTEAEHVLMWNAGGMSVLPGVVSSTVSFTIDTAFRMETPTYQLHASSNEAPKASRNFAVRCVARGPGGPARGYIRQDIALEEWNRYQLFKLN